MNETSPKHHRTIDRQIIDFIFTFWLSVLPPNLRLAKEANNYVSAVVLAHSGLIIYISTNNLL
jgi:hypothetical protein